MQYREDIVIATGMNTDDDPRWLQQGDYVEARNLRVGSAQDQGGGGLVQTMRSTLAYVLPPPGGSSSVTPDFLGAATDEANDRAFIFCTAHTIYAGTTDDFFIIYKHDVRTDVVKPIFASLADNWNITAYSKDDPNSFYNPRIVNDILIWTDNKNDVRQVDVRRAEITHDAGIFDKVPAWVAGPPGYGTGFKVYYVDRVYKALQNTISALSSPPPDVPTYWQDIAAVADVYLDITNPDNFTFAAQPPLLAPTVAYKSDSSRNTNQLRGRTWQFSYRYVYMDWRKSTYAPPSVVPAPSLEENPDGSSVTDPQINNAIEVTVHTGSPEVRIIEMVYRSSDDLATWLQFRELVLFEEESGSRIISEESTVRSSFYNDTLAVAQPISTVLQPFTFVPIRAKHMELIEGNRVAFANITEGYGRTITSVNIEIAWEDLAGAGVGEIPYTWESKFYGDFPDWLNYLKFTLPINPPEDGAPIKISIDQGDGAGEKTASATYNTGDSWPSKAKVDLSASMNSVWGAGTTVASPVDPVDDHIIWAFELPGILVYLVWDIRFYTEGPVADLIYKYPTLKTGTVQSWGFIYRDVAGRLGPVNGIEAIKTYIPFCTEDTSSNVNRRPLINFHIGHVPPDWAHSYEIVYYGNKTMNWWLHLYGYNFAYAKTTHEDPADFGFILGAEFDIVGYRLRIKKAQSNTRTRIIGWSVEEYVWQKGDRIRIIGKVSDTGTLVELDGYIYDAEITGVFTDTDRGSTIGEPWPTPTLPDDTEYVYDWIYFGKDTIGDFKPTFVLELGIDARNAFPDELFVEIYRPFTAETGVFFTTGMTFLVDTDQYGHKFHKGNTDQVLTSGGAPSSPAIVANTAQDAWKYYRGFSANITLELPELSDAITFYLFSESQYASDYFITQKLYAQGFPIPVLESAKQNVLTKRLRHGGVISIGSQVNFIADFQFDEFKDLKDEDGPIEGIREVGFILKALQSTRVTAIYLSRQESFTAAGDPQYLFTDKVFGSTRPSLERWGTSHPESVIVDDRNLYFWDQTEGIVCRDSPNGQAAISNNKMKKWFDDKAREMDQIVEPAEQIAISAFSQEHDELMISFGRANAATKGDTEMVVFSEKDGRWKHFIDFSFDYGRMYWIGKRLFHVQENDGNVYEWWAGADYRQIGQTRPNSYLGFNTRAARQKVKTFDSIHVYQTGETPRFDDIQIPAKASAIEDGTVMQTKILASNINEREGIWYCQVMRDILDPDPASGIDDDEKMQNGRRLRGLYMYVRMEFLENDVPVTLSNISVISTPSERSYGQRGK